MPIRYVKHNRPLKNRKQAKVRENKFVRVEWKDRRDVLVKPYEFDHPLTLRAPDGRVSRSYYEFTLRKNKTLLVVDINKLDTSSASLMQLCAEQSASPQRKQRRLESTRAKSFSRQQKKRVTFLPLLDTVSFGLTTWPKKPELVNHTTGEA